MPAVSQQQQKLFGLALAVKRGEVSRSEASDEVLNIVDSMSEKDIEDFASTSHEGLPKQVEARLRETLRELMREMAIQEAELPAAPIPSAIKAKLAQAIDKIKDTNLTYNQKLQVIGRVVDSLGVDKKELAKMSSKLKTTLESLNEDDPCWKDYEMIGMKKKNGKEVPNCVPKSESVNEGSHGMATKLLQSIINGDSSRAEGIKMSKELAQHFMNWVKTSPFGKKYSNLPLDMLVKASFNWGIERGLDSKLKGELSKLKSTIKESVNEVASRTAMEIGGLTGMNKDAIQKFVDEHNLDIEKVFQFVKKGKLSDRMDFMTAVVGKPGNPIQKKMIKMFGESVNEAFSDNKNLNYIMKGRKVTNVAYDSDFGFAVILDNGKYVLFNTHSARPGQSKDMEFESVKEGKKRFNQKNNVGSSKYVISYHDGQKKHKDGSDFFDIQIFKNQKDLETFKKALLSKGFIEESLVKEDANMNKKVKAFLDKELNDLSKGRPNHQFAVMHILMGALTDANFHSDAKKVPSIFPRAKYEGDPQGEKDLIDMYEYEIGPKIANICKWDGKDIVMAIGFYVSMTIGRPVGEKVEKLVESINEEKYPIAVAEFNKELIKHPMVKKAAQFYKKTPAEIVKVLQQRLYTKGDKGGETKEVWIDFKDTTSGIEIKHKMKFNESNESHDCGCGCGGVTEGGCGGSKTNESFTPDPRKVYGGTAAKEGMVLVKQDGFKKILDLSKKNPSNVFLVSDDNYTKFGPFYVKNGKVAKYTVANPNYDFERNKVGSIKVPSDVILKFKVVE